MNQNDVLVVIDVQNEYITPSRPFFIRDIASSLAKAKQVLNTARRRGTPVIHVQHLQDGEIFNAGNDFSKFVEGFEPLPQEKVVLKSNYSSFSSPDFDEALQPYKSGKVFVIGYGSTMCCLSTIIEGYHRGYQMVFIQDASLAKKTQKFEEKEMHMYATEIIGTYAKVIAADALNYSMPVINPPAEQA